MNIRTVNLSLPAPAAEVFAFFARIDNLPLWATEFCERVWLDGGTWRLATSQGEMTGNFRCHTESGVIDQFIGPSAEQQGLFPIRVFSLGQVSVVQFTFMQPPGLPDAVYEKQYASLLTEMRGIGRRFGGGTLHAPGRPGEAIAGQQ